MLDRPNDAANGRAVPKLWILPALGAGSAGKVRRSGHSYRATQVMEVAETDGELLGVSRHMLGKLQTARFALLCAVADAAAASTCRRARTPTTGPRAAVTTLSGKQRRLAAGSLPRRYGKDTRFRNGLPPGTALQARAVAASHQAHLCSALSWQPLRRRALHV